MWCVSLFDVFSSMVGWSVLEEVCDLGELKSRWRLLEFGVTLSAPMEFEEVDGVWMSICECMVCMCMINWLQMSSSTKSLACSTEPTGLTTSETILSSCSTSLLIALDPLLCSTGRVGVCSATVFFLR